MKTIRYSVFETNSSSTHSISISENMDLLDSITPNEDGNIVLTGGEFGWSWIRFNDTLTKANYCAVDQKDNEQNLALLVKVLKDQTGAKEIIFYFSEDDNKPNWSYIDHDSEGNSNTVFKNEETLRNFLFNPKSILFTGNDNTLPPPNFYDDVDTLYVEKIVLGKYELKLTKPFEDYSEDEKIEILNPVFEQHCNNISQKTKKRWTYSAWKPLDKQLCSINLYAKLDQNIFVILNEENSKSLHEKDESGQDFYKGTIYSEKQEVKFEVEKI